MSNKSKHHLSLIFVSEVNKKGLSSLQVIFLNTMALPTVLAKTVKLFSSEVMEEEIPCRLCMKKFASEIALRNHAKVQHIDEFYSGDESIWRVMPKKSQNPLVPKVHTEIKEEAEKQLTEIKKNEIISSMEPVNLASLASEDISYIIIKSEKAYTPVVNKRKSRKQKKQKEEKNLSGPFECLEPSEASPDGLCHQIFLSCCLYSEHFRDEHTKRHKHLRCQVCEKPLQHKIVNQDCPYTCQACGEEFATKVLLSMHIEQVHEELKPFQCDVCRKRFTQKAAVKRHMVMHTGDRPFACTFCPKTFTQKTGLEVHLRIHTKEKPYRCVICDKSFCQSIHLQLHMRIHTNLAPFECSICQKRFKQSCHLNNHLKCHNVNNLNEEEKEKYIQMMDSDNTEILEVEIGDFQVEQIVECE